MILDLAHTFKNKQVLVTGHTGFKGAWLALWLKILGAEVTGISLDPATQPSLSELTSTDLEIADTRHDIRDSAFVSDLIQGLRPDYVFHLAAQAIVSRSFREPRETFETNVLGTINVLDGLRLANRPAIAVMVTSDKAYLNKEWPWGYREIDQLGGHDPYSGSKAATELALAAYISSYFSRDSAVRVGIARAGNVIGGGDWSADRIIPDAVRSWQSKQTLLVRNSLSTRPWQHVLEPLSGYLQLAANLATDPQLSGEAFNFGPFLSDNRSVGNLIQEVQSRLPGLEFSSNPTSAAIPEAALLQLNCEKAKALLGWRSILSFEETIELTCDWYRRFYDDPEHALELTTEQINHYSNLQRKRR